MTTTHDRGLRLRGLLPLSEPEPKPGALGKRDFYGRKVEVNRELDDAKEQCTPSAPALDHTRVGGGVVDLTFDDDDDGSGSGSGLAAGAFQIPGACVRDGVSGDGFRFEEKEGVIIYDGKFTIRKSTMTADEHWKIERTTWDLLKREREVLKIVKDVYDREAAKRRPFPFPPLYRVS